MKLKRYLSRLQILTGSVVFVAAFATGSLATLYLARPASPQVVVTASGLKYVDLVEGQGATPRLGQFVRVHYIGWLENGTEFENSHKRNTPVEFSLGPGLIPGWNEALQTMKVGGKRQITLPPQLAYREAGRPPNIPRNATLIFEVELLAVR